MMTSEPAEYDCTLPSNRFAESVESTTTTEFPGTYARSLLTVSDCVPPSTGIGVTALVVLDKYLSPATPVGPVVPL